MPDGSHVYLNIGGRWGVRQTGDARARRLFDTREQALVFAREEAKRRNGVIYIHDNSGRVAEKVVVD